MIIILFGEGEEVDRVYRLSVERVIVYQRENVERSKKKKSVGRQFSSLITKPGQNPLPEHSEGDCVVTLRFY